MGIIPGHPVRSALVAKRGEQKSFRLAGPPPHRTIYGVVGEKWWVLRWACDTVARAQGHQTGEGFSGRASLTVSRGHLEYPGPVSTSEHEIDFAEVAGIRIEQAFALCSFASQLVGKALR